MKRLFTCFTVLALVCFASVALAADVPNLVGTWEGAPSVHSITGGHYTGKLVLTITGQKGNAFNGTKVYKMPAPEKDRSENFSGTIGSTGQIFIADHEEGIMIGNLTRSGGMELQYGHNGKTAVAVHVVLKRK